MNEFVRAVRQFKLTDQLQNPILLQKLLKMKINNYFYFEDKKVGIDARMIDPVVFISMK